VLKRGFVLVNVELSCGAGAVELLDVTGAGGLVEGWGSAMLEELALIVCGEVCRQGAKSWHRGGDSEGGTRLGLFGSPEALLGFGNFLWTADCCQRLRS